MIFFFKLWEKLSPTTQYEVKSGFHTFLTAAVMQLMAQYSQSGHVLPTTATALIAIASVVLRAGIKAVFSQWYGQSPLPPVSGT